MMNLGLFIGPITNVPPMRVEVIDIDGKVGSTFVAPPGFQLERYVDARHPNREFMVYSAGDEINISVIDNDQIIEIYKGTYV